MELEEIKCYYYYMKKPWVAKLNRLKRPVKVKEIKETRPNVKNTNKGSTFKFGKGLFSAVFVLLGFIISYNGLELSNRGIAFNYMIELLDNKTRYVLNEKALEPYADYFGDTLGNGEIIFDGPMIDLKIESGAVKKMYLMYDDGDYITFKDITSVAQPSFLDKVKRNYFNSSYSFKFHNPADRGVFVPKARAVRIPIEEFYIYDTIFLYIEAYSGEKFLDTIVLSYDIENKKGDFSCKNVKAKKITRAEILNQVYETEDLQQTYLKSVQKSYIRIDSYIAKSSQNGFQPFD